MSIKSVLDKFQYLRPKNLGEIIYIQEYGEEPEPVELIRKGRQNVRVKRMGEREPFLVDIDKVVIK